ncbi:MAG: helix-turn-helix transcriptional regulator [Lachnospiraceae bacterium]|nr:helix-turn-helix transcriptional regulator [Lachnospiraceae bacterium]
MDIKQIVLDLCAMSDEQDWFEFKENWFQEELPSLRAKIGVSQEELSDIVGISRPTYSAIETKKRKMSWNVFLSLLMCFTQNEKTALIIDSIGEFPDEFRETLNVNNRK